MIKFLLFMLGMFILTGMVSNAKEIDKIRGSLVIVGGALETSNKGVYNKFIELAMKYRKKTKDEIKIGIMPAASLSPVKSGKAYTEDFMSYGVPEKNIEIIPIAIKDDKETQNIDESTWKDNGKNPQVAKKIKDYDAIWFVGGDQIRYTRTLYDKGKNTPVLDAVWEIYKKGAVLGGSSAGAAIMSDPMIGGGESMGALNNGVTWEDSSSVKGDKRVFLTKGLGFFTYGMVDQHFNQRGRLGRLIVAAMETNNKLGFGIDEDTAMIVYNDTGTIEVIGTNGLTIVNLSKAVKDNKKKHSEIKDIVISYIENGDTYDINKDEFKILQRDFLTEYDYAPQITATSIFDKIKYAITLNLFDDKVKDTMGISFELKGEEKAEGFILKFRKEKDTKIFCGEIKGNESFAAVKVHMDIIPVIMTIKKDVSSIHTVREKLKM
jgi:cyanophycinase